MKNSHLYPSACKFYRLEAEQGVQKRNMKTAPQVLTALPRAGRPRENTLCLSFSLSSGLAQRVAEDSFFIISHPQHLSLRSYCLLENTIMDQPLITPHDPS